MVPYNSPPRVHPVVFPEPLPCPFIIMMMTTMKAIALVRPLVSPCNLAKGQNTVQHCIGGHAHILSDYKIIKIKTFFTATIIISLTCRPRFVITHTSNSFKRPTCAVCLWLLKCPCIHAPTWPIAHTLPWIPPPCKHLKMHSFTANNFYKQTCEYNNNIYTTYIRLKSSGDPSSAAHQNKRG